MASSKYSLFKSWLNYLSNECVTNMGNIIITSTIIGWIASSGAQIFGITRNKKYTKAEKKYMINQEIADAGINILSYLAITHPLKGLSSKLVSTGKWAPSEIVSHMRSTNTLSRRGAWSFDVTKTPGFNNVKDVYDKFYCFTGSVAAILGGILSTNILVPIARNKFASHRQNKYLKKNNQIDISNTLQPPTSLETNPKNPVSPVVEQQNRVPQVTNPQNPIRQTQHNTFDVFKHRNNNMAI